MDAFFFLFFFLNIEWMRDGPDYWVMCGGAASGSGQLISGSEWCAQWVQYHGICHIGRMDRCLWRRPAMIVNWVRERPRGSGTDRGLLLGGSLF